MTADKICKVMKYTLKIQHVVHNINFNVGITINDNEKFAQPTWFNCAVNYDKCVYNNCSFTLV